MSFLIKKEKRVSNRPALQWSYLTDCCAEHNVYIRMCIYAFHVPANVDRKRVPDPNSTKITVQIQLKFRHPGSEKQTS